MISTKIKYNSITVIKLLNLWILKNTKPYLVLNHKLIKLILLMKSNKIKYNSITVIKLQNNHKDIKVSIRILIKIHNKIYILTKLTHQNNNHQYI